MTTVTIGRLENEVGFKVDRQSWKNLDKFQKRIDQLKKQMGKMPSGGFSLGGRGGGGGNTPLEKYQRRLAKKDHDHHLKAYKDHLKRLERQERQLVQRKDTLSAKKIRMNRATAGLKDAQAAGFSRRLSSLGDRFLGGGISSKEFSAEVANLMSVLSEAKSAARRSRQESGIAQRRDDQRKDMVNARNIRTSGYFDRNRKTLNSDQIAGFRQEMTSLNNRFLQGQLTTREYSASVSNVQARMSQANRDFKTFNQRFKELRSVMVAGGIGYAAFEAGRQTMQVGQSFEAVQSKLLVGLGDENAVSESLQLAREQAKRLGLDLLVTTDSFARLQIAAKQKLPQKEINELFISYNELGTAAGIDTERMKLGMRAMEQMLNKGTLMAEEVKNQFSESIPGGLAIFSRAVGVSEKDFLKMMESGELLASEVLPKVAKEMAKMAREGGALEKKMQSNRAAMSRMITSFQDFANTIFVSGFGNILTKTFDSIRNLMTGITPLAAHFTHVLNVAFTTVTLPIRLFIAALADLTDYFGWTGESAKNFGGTLVGLALGAAVLAKLKTLMAIIFGGKILSGIVMLIPQVIKLGGAFLTFGKMAGMAVYAAMGPIGIILGLVTAAAGIIYAFWDDISGWFGSTDINANATVTRGPEAIAASVARQAAREQNMNNNVAIELDLKSDMLDARIREGSTGSIAQLQSQLQANSAF